MKLFEILESKHKITYKILGLKLTFNNNKAIQNNCVIVIENNIERKVKSIKGLKIKFEGSNNKIIIRKPNKFKNCKITCKNNCIFKIGAKPKFHKDLNIALSGDNSTMIIGKNFNHADLTVRCGDEPNTKIEIGDDCLFSDDIRFMTTDGHVIYDNITKEPLKTWGDIKIGNHVWLGHGVICLKNTVIPDNCIIGCNSVISKDLKDENCIYAGAPIRKIKENINWKHDTISSQSNF